VDRSFIDQNRASTERIKSFARLSDEQLQRPIGEGWTGAALLAHLAFWDRRVLAILEKTLQEGKLAPIEPGTVVNDIALPLWAAIPPREAARLAVETAEETDRRLEEFPPALLEALYNYNPRMVNRSLHRNEHLDRAEEAIYNPGK
jgi:hypothetical protein